jgi:hypothetical protein
MERSEIKKSLDVFYYKMLEEDLMKIKDEIKDECARYLISFYDCMIDKYKGRKPIKSRISDEAWDIFIEHIVSVFSLSDECRHESMNEFVKGSVHIINHIKKGEEKCKECDEDVWDTYF